MKYAWRDGKLLTKDEQPDSVDNCDVVGITCLSWSKLNTTHIIDSNVVFQLSHSTNNGRRIGGR